MECMIDMGIYQIRREEQLDIYMKVPKRIVLGDTELNSLGAKTSNNLALLLKRALYGLKQAGLLWSKILDPSCSKLVLSSVRRTCVCTSSKRRDMQGGRCLC